VLSTTVIASNCYCSAIRHLVQSVVKLWLPWLVAVWLSGIWTNCYFLQFAIDNTNWTLYRRN